jgi:hypothetical protein
MADLVTIATTAVLTQFLGPTAKHLGEQALERGKQVAVKATALLAQVGREPQPVEPKLLLPLVQAASLESDPILIDKWAALLANAADPAQQTIIHPSYVEVLRQLSPREAIILQYIYSHHPPEDDDYAFSHIPTEADVIRVFGLDFPEIFAALENLQRLFLFKLGTENAMGERIEETSGQQRLEVNQYGVLFLRAVTPPIA